MRIALIDDDRGVRESLRFFFEVAGHGVSDFASAADFLEAGEIDTVDALVLDQNMPDCTGLELVGRLQDDQRRFPIVLVTAAATPVVIARAAELGVTEVLSKPVPPAELTRLLGRLSEQLTRLA